MQKKSRFLTGLLSAVMALTLFALPATAEVITNANTIDTGKTGSITIHKYEYNGTGGQAGTGEASDETNVPNKDGDVEGAKPLDGVTFEIYKVLDADNLVKYYNNPTDFTQIVDTNSKPLSTSLTENNAWTKYAEAKTDGEIGYKWKGGAVSTETSLFYNDVTKGGKVTFSSLPVGLYLVIEKDAPSQVTGASDPFFVSIPMTRQNANGNTEWLYTVEVFPKNKTTYGDISLVKDGYVGGPTDGNVPEKLKGVTFKLYQFTGKNGVAPFTGAPSTDWKEITGKTANGSAVNTITNEKGEITVSGLAAGDYCFVEDAVGDNQAYIIDQRPYYFRMNNDSTSQAFTFDTNGSVNLVGEAGKNLRIQANNYRPDVEKQVKKGNGYDARADYSIGDYIPYRVTVTVPENIANLKTFVVTDTPENLEFVQGDTAHPFAVTCGNDTISTDAYKVTKNAKSGFDLTFTATSLANYKGQKIVIDYYAKLLDTAKSDTTGNRNMVSLKYTNKIDANGKPVEGSEKEIQDNVVVYSFGIKVKKTDGSGNLLDGVEFDLYRVDEKGEANLSDFGWKDSDVKLTKVNATSLVTDKGMIEVNGLADGTYYLVETKTLKDYNLLSKAVEVNLDITYTAKWEEQGKYEDGKLIHHSTTNFTEKFANGDEDDPMSLTTTVINRKGFTLPRTGGFGTLLFSGIGALLVVGGVGVLMGTKKKKDNA